MGRVDLHANATRPAILSALLTVVQDAGIPAET